MPQIISTTEVHPRLRLAYWADMVCDTYVQLDCSPIEGASTIEGQIAHADISTLGLSLVTASAQCVSRTSTRIGKATEDYFLVSIQKQGRSVIEQDGRVALLDPGDFALYDSTRPYTLRFPSNFQQYVLKFPGSVLRSELPFTEQLTASAVSGLKGAGHLMINMIRTLAEDVDTLALESSAAVADSVRQILIAGLSTLPAARRNPTTKLRTYHLERIKACVRARLRDPELSITSIASELKISSSTLHRTWEDSATTLSDWIWTQRLDAAHRDLSDPGMAGKSITEIAFSWGFNDAAHFSRSFKSRFGFTPRELRVKQRDLLPRKCIP